MKRRKYTYKIKFNRQKKEYIISAYNERGQFITKYRSHPQGAAYTEEWTQNDIRNLLKSGECYEVRRR